MKRSVDFQTLIIDVLTKYGFNAEGFAKFAGIPPRTVQHWVRGDNRTPSPENERKLYRALAKLEEPNQDKPDKLIDLTGSSSPVMVKWGNVMITLEDLIEA